MAIPGVGPVVATTILVESGDVTRFQSARQYAAYCGLVPRVRSSAGSAKLGHITKAGPSDLRWAISTAVTSSTRTKAPGAHTVMYRRKKRRNKPPKVAICAGANTLARMIYAVLTRDTPYHPAKAA